MFYCGYDTARREYILYMLSSLFLRLLSLLCWTVLPFSSASDSVLFCLGDAHHVDDDYGRIMILRDQL